MGITPSLSDDDAAIIAQVNYYFSNANLLGLDKPDKRPDWYLLSQSDGTEYVKVRYSTITRFGKMKSFKPQSVVKAAIDKSTEVEFTDNSRKVLQRKMPLPYMPVREANDDYEGRVAPKRDNWSKTSDVSRPRGPDGKLVKVTGFEPNYIDAPISPEEYKVEQDLYHHDMAIHERLEYAIHRFKARRTFPPKQVLYFNKWLKYGGIECGQKQFTGNLSLEDMSEMDAAEIIRATATHHAGDEKMDSDKWALDFEGVAAGYLSCNFPDSCLNYNRDDAELQCRIMRSLYNYLIVHNVCPENNDDLSASIAITELAEKQLPLIREFHQEHPGDFNMACSTLFGGHCAEAYGQDGSEWANYGKLDNPYVPAHKSRTILRTAILALGSDSIFEAIATICEPNLNDKFMQLFKFTDVIRKTGLEVIDIQFPTEECVAEYDKVNGVRKGLKYKLVPCGKLICKTWKRPDFLETWDLPYNHVKENIDPNTTYEFWFESSILKKCFLGMKLIATIRRLSVEGCDESIWVMDEVGKACCSFFKYLLNENCPKPFKPITFYSQEDADTEEAKEEHFSDLNSDSP